MKCPKDAECYWTTKHDYEATVCNSHVDKNSNPGIYIYAVERRNKRWCTRPKNHRGKHHCHSRTEECIQTWTTEEALIDAL